MIEIEGSCDVENTVFVAVGKNVKESKSTLLWALEYFAGRDLCLLHVHQPAQFLHFIDEKLSASKLKQQASKAYRELERQKMHKLLNQYLAVLDKVEAGKIWIEMERVDEGIVHIIAQKHIRWLVMGAATEKQYSKKLSELKSKKAIYVYKKAPVYCQIWFACNGFLICSRPANVTSKIEHIEMPSSKTNTKGAPLQLDDRVDAYEYADESESLERLNNSKVIDNPTSTALMMVETKEDSLTLALADEPPEFLFHSLSANLLEESPQGQGTSDLYHKLEHATIFAEKSKQAAFEESIKRWNAEEDAREALRKAEESTSICMKETSEREELEDMLAKQRQEIESMKNQHLQCIEELKVIREQTPVLESQITKSHHLEKELEEKIIQAVELLIKFREQRDELQMECEMATGEVKELRNLSEKDTMALSCSQFFVLPFLEIIEATQNFDPSLKIGEGKSGCFYKGLLRHVKVAIKMLPSHGSQSDLEFENEAGVLSRVRHPNLVQLVGICPESRSLVYEYCENGNLKDRLMCEKKTPPLPWQSRVKMVVDICSGLAFLHSSNPCIVHGNIKLSSILLDSNFVGKLSNMGLYRFISLEGSTHNTSISMGSEASVYMDPEFYETGQLTTESDVYSFGMVLLQLLTGRMQASGVVKDVKCALENGNFETVLDISAGDWPLELAKQAALLALRCCEKKRVNRPNIISDVWRLIHPMRNLCAPASLGTQAKRRIPSHFVCPIFQEVMKDPYIAADGFTYEADAIKGWLNSGHKTSPMTNLQLDHCDLLPNSALYYAIQEWEQQS